MSKKKEYIPQTDIYYFNKKGELNISKKHEIVKEFRYKDINFYLIYKDGFYGVCYAYEGRLFSLCQRYNNLTPSEVVKKFKEGFTANKITLDDIKTFIREPLKYARKKKKNENNKKHN